MTSCFAASPVVSSAESGVLFTVTCRTGISEVRRGSRATGVTATKAGQSNGYSSVLTTRLLHDFGNTWCLMMSKEHYIVQSSRPSRWIPKTVSEYKYSPLKGECLYYALTRKPSV